MSAARSVPAAEANRQFSKLLRDARAGARITITSHGEPVAVLGPVEADAGSEMARRLAALAELEAHWATLPVITIGAFDMDTLYDRDLK